MRTPHTASAVSIHAVLVRFRRCPTGSGRSRWWAVRESVCVVATAGAQRIAGGPSATWQATRDLGAAVQGARGGQVVQLSDNGRVATARVDEGSGGITVRLISHDGVVEDAVEEIPALLKRDDAFLWLDVPQWTRDVDDLLATELNLHAVARAYCKVRNHMPMVHGYRDHVFMVLHRPVVLGAGDTLLVELDMFVGDRFVVTVHNRDEAQIAQIEGMSEVEETLDRINGGRIRPRTPIELTHALVSLMALRQRLLVQDVAVRVADVEQRVLRRQLADPEQDLEEMFHVRYQLLSVRTTAAHSEEVLARARKLLGPDHHDDEVQLADLQDMFRRVHRMTDSEQELLAGVIDLYRTRTDTKMMIAMERIAVLAAVTLPVTAIASVYGMNVIVNAQTDPVQLIIALIIMAMISGVLLRWTKKQGWW
jgi:magnesium transporter